MFDQLTDKLNHMVSKLRGHGKLTEKNIEEALRDIRMALLEADVHFKVVQTFVESVKQEALGQAVIDGVAPAQQFVKIVYDALVKTMGEHQAELSVGASAHGKIMPTVMMVGLQGSGKTTTSAKLAKFLKKKGRQPYLIPADVSRPAAIEQLTMLAKRENFAVFPTSPKESKPHKFVPDAIKTGKKLGQDVAIVDTAGRLHIDAELMDDLVKLKKKIEPDHIILVVDAMTGQDALKVATTFHQALGLSGVILTKMDGDAKGGAALSIKAMCGVPIFFFGTGETLSDLEPFYPDRLASRILDRGDIVSLVEKAQDLVDEKTAEKMQADLLKNAFTLETFRDQLKQMKRLGSVESLVNYLPGAKKLTQAIDMGSVTKDLKKKEAILNSMTVKERKNPDILNGKRRRRIASGSGTHPSDVNRLIKEFEQMRQMMKLFKKGGLGQLKQMMRM